MLRVESNTKLEGFTEFEEGILFDEDDPDFDGSALQNMPILFRMPSTMSLASVHPAELHSSRSSLTTLSHSLDDIADACWGAQMHSEAVMTIEELRNQLNCCFSCGVSWADSHVSLDCSECGGYALERPCPVCEGTCGTSWKRDLSMSHASGRARWTGECTRSSCTAPQQHTPKGSAIAQELSSRMEKLSANS
ncbi:protein pinocchio [Anoplophora glabripennis]|uniref:protein pinocchio n=1 Tax=Anoplophora glabripennis TaxID=217634 RepID=UPI0008755277|nr:protein pinocchio [Anoplophora glabripennis]